MITLKEAATKLSYRLLDSKKLDDFFFVRLKQPRHQSFFYPTVANETQQKWYDFVYSRQQSNLRSFVRIKSSFCQTSLNMLAALFLFLSLKDGASDAAGR